MEKKFGKLVSNVGKNAKDILEKSKNKAVQIADQNDDGKFDLEDVTAMANSVGNIVKKGARTLKETADEKARQMERKTLLPIVLEDLNDYPMPKLIRITERDKKYSESEVCKGSIGFWSDFKEMRLMNIFRDSVNVYGISFYPNCDSEFYYVNPVNYDNYIVLDEYFDYLKQVRVGELQKIAQDLGAKHFRVTYKEEKTAFSERRTNKKVGVKSIEDASGEQESEGNKYSKIEIAAEMECPGHAPVKPTVKYMKYYPNVQKLIEKLMDEQGQFILQT